MNDKLRFQYVRHPLNNSQYIGVICFLVADGNIYCSFSQCNPVDQFSKKIGRAIAQHRVENNYTPSEVPISLYNVDGTRFRVKPITATLQEEVNRFYQRKNRNKVQNQTLSG